MLHGIDVSYAQGNPSWDEAAKDPRVKFVISRVCYGSNPADDDGPIFNRNHDECKRLNIPFGAYIFFRFTEDPGAQAVHFLNMAAGRYGQIRPMVDVEEGSGTTGDPYQNILALGTFNSAIQAALGVQPIIYTNADTWDTTMGGTDAFSGHSLHVASYGSNDGSGAGNPVLPQGFSKWAIHQYTSRGHVQGVSNYVDLNVVNGDSLEGLRR
jgi:lysozyme